MSKVLPLILAGGVGSRLWPESRFYRPKQFSRFSGNFSLFQKAFSRACSVCSDGSVIISTNENYYHTIKSEIDELDDLNSEISYILEPSARNTAPSIACSAIWAAENVGDDVIMVVLNADQLIENRKAFEDSVSRAIVLAESGKLVNIGVRPKYPHTGYGYIELDGNEVKRFVEKPNSAVASEFFMSGNFLWNTGICCFSVGAVLSEMKNTCPTVFFASQDCLLKSCSRDSSNKNLVKLDSRLFSTIPKEAFDTAVLERSNKVAAVESDIGWRDLGDWESVFELFSEDQEGNRICGDSSLLIDCRKTNIRSGGRTVVGIGLENILISDTEDATLVIDRSNIQTVKEAVAKMESMGWRKSVEGLKNYRPWGHFENIASGEGYKVKVLEIAPNAMLSLQRHQHRSEHWVIVRGRVRVVNDRDEMFLNTGETVTIKRGAIHRVSNEEKIPAILVETQIGEILEEEDIERIDDIYGRKNQSVIK